MLDELKNFEQKIKTFYSKISDFVEKRKSYSKILLLIFTSIILAQLLTPTYSSYPREYTVGMIAKTNIHSPADVLVEDTETTKKKMAEAELSVPPVYDYITNLYDRIDSKITDAFKTAREKLQNGESFTQSEFSDLLAITITREEFNLLLKNKFSTFIERSIKNLISQVLNGVFVTKDYKELEGIKSISARTYYYNVDGNLSFGREVKITDLSRISSYDEAIETINVSGKRALRRNSNAFRNTIINIAQKLLEPNLILNRVETENRKLAAKQNIKPALFQLKRGEIIVREGEKIDEEAILKLNAIRKSENKLHLFFQYFGTFLLLLTIGYVTISFAAGSIKKFNYDFRNLLFISVNILLFALLLYVSDIIIKSIQITSSLTINTFQYLIPVAISGMLTRTLLNSETTFVLSGIFAILAGILFDNNLEFAIYTFTGCLSGANFSAYFTQRSILIKAGVKTGIINMCLVLIFYLLKPETPPNNLLFGILFGFMSGMLSSVIATGLIPIFESLFGYATDMRLLELINVDHPLMKELSMKAPGSYHHSVMVAALAESAARAIGANPIIARVGAYYHDVGKTKMPHYFIENQFGTDNKHDTISPRMSSIIIFSHVKEGCELSQKYKLPEVVRNIISQHHGTSLVKYFYEKAKEMPGYEDLNESDYRYPGPKPKTKEAGIIMLADTIEAAARTLKNPSVPQLQHMVERLIGYIFSDGQLEECMLTLRDLHEIGRSFVKVLAGFTHQRIDYPIQLNIETEKMKENGNSIDRKKQNAQQKDKKDSDIYLKKIGLS
jgi:putative nucleotidyltransferase with HDIG domain